MQNLLDPAILFFIFGVLAGFVRSNLEIPPAISRFLSLYLLMALGLKGGFALAQSGLTAEVATSLGVAILLAIIVPALGYWILKRFLSGFDAAAIAATYGSVSAVTFVTAIQFLENQEIAYGGHMAAAMALPTAPLFYVCHNAPPPFYVCHNARLVLQPAHQWCGVYMAHHPVKRPPSQGPSRA